jgi:hypothetical protein
MRLLFLALLLVAGCGSGRLPDPPEAERTRLLQAAPDAVRAAARAFMEGEGLHLVAATGPDEVWEGPAIGPAAMFGPTTQRITLTVAPTGAGTRLVMLIRLTGADGSRVSVTPVLMRMDYSRYLSGIASRVGG